MLLRVTFLILILSITLSSVEISCGRNVIGLTWTSVLGGSEFDVGWSVQQTSDGGYIIAGGTESFGAGGRDVYLVKTDSEGMEEWSRTFGGSEFDVGWS
ncbi:MAG: hypothetical protein JSV18_01310, partial [Candidatus Bathyarchaeota archaeon]